MKLREIACSRSGDKGEMNNICVFVYDDADWEFLQERLTVDLVAERFGPLVRGSITRYELPNLHGLNFVMEKALEGVALSLRSDAGGKTRQSLILDVELGDR
jgi:hypothetical protein